jgi:hypothetical protein
MKLVYGFDAERRQPSSFEDPASSLPDRESIVSSLQETFKARQADVRGLLRRYSDRYVRLSRPEVPPLRTIVTDALQMCLTLTLITFWTFAKPLFSDRAAIQCVTRVRQAADFSRSR